MPSEHKLVKLSNLAPIGMYKIGPICLSISRTLLSHHNIDKFINALSVTVEPSRRNTGKSLYAYYVPGVLSAPSHHNIGKWLYHPGLAEINAPVGPQEVVGHTLNSQLLIG